MGWLKPRFTVSHSAWTEETPDGWGSPTRGWADPVVVEVFGWAPPSPDTEIRDIGTGTRRDLDLYAPTGFTRPRDRVTVDGVLYECVGWPEDYTHGPFGFEAGYRINLKRVEG